MRQQIRFCTTTDDVRLAYATAGQGPPLLRVGGWLTHVERDWHSPVWRHWHEALAGRHTLARFDLRGFKQALEGILPPEVERSTYLLATTVALAVLFWLWQPMPHTIWNVESLPAQAVLYTIFGAGWLLIMVSIMLIDFWGFFGLRQVYAYMGNRHAFNPGFVTPLFYQFVRHPIYLGLLMAFWSVPHMTQGHLLFSSAMSVYIFAAVRLEERDLIATLGERYERYREEVPMIAPLPGRRATASRQVSARS